MNKIDKLKKGQRERVGDGFITDYDYINDDGDKIIDNSRTHSEYGEVEEIHNQSKLFTPGRSTTTDVSLLIAEAELLEEDRVGRNPHIPASMDILERAEAQIEERDLTPAWTVFEDSDTHANGTGSEASAD